MSNILIIKHGSLGDIVQISGALKVIRENFSDKKIFILTTPKFKSLFQLCPYIDNVLIDRRLPRWNFFYLLKLIKDIKKFNFEYCFDLQNSSRTEFYRKNFKIDNWSSSRTILTNTETKEEFDKEGVIERFKIQLDRSNLKNTNEVLRPNFNWAIDEQFEVQFDKYFYISPFASPKHKNKIWPYFKDLIQLIKTKFPNYKIITSPGPSEIGMAKKLDLEMILYNEKPTSINQLTKIINQAEFVISNDTGPAHIASHLRKKGVAIFGPHTSAKKVSIETENFKSIETDNLKNLSADKVLEIIEKQIST